MPNPTDKNKDFAKMHKEWMALANSKEKNKKAINWFQRVAPTAPPKRGEVDKLVDEYVKKVNSQHIKKPSRKDMWKNLVLTASTKNADVRKAVEIAQALNVPKVIKNATSKGIKRIPQGHRWRLTLADPNFISKGTPQVRLRDSIKQMVRPVSDGGMGKMPLLRNLIGSNEVSYPLVEYHGGSAPPQQNANSSPFSNAALPNIEDLNGKPNRTSANAYPFIAALMNETTELAKNANLAERQMRRRLQRKRSRPVRPWWHQYTKPLHVKRSKRSTPTRSVPAASGAVPNGRPKRRITPTPVAPAEGRIVPQVTTLALPSNLPHVIDKNRALQMARRNANLTRAVSEGVLVGERRIPITPTQVARIVREQQWKNSNRGRQMLQKINDEMSRGRTGEVNSLLNFARSQGTPQGTRDVIRLPPPNAKNRSHRAYVHSTDDMVEWVGDHPNNVHMHRVVPTKKLSQLRKALAADGQTKRGKRIDEKYARLRENDEKARRVKGKKRAKSKRPRPS